MSKIMSQSWVRRMCIEKLLETYYFQCSFFLLVQLSCSSPQSLNFPRGDSLLGPTLLGRSSSLTDSLLGRDNLNPLLDPLGSSLGGMTNDLLLVNKVKHLPPQAAIS